MPPPELRILTGRLDEAEFDNVDHQPVYPDLPVGAYESVFDFGCACGRLARRLLLQKPQPKRFMGIDLHRPSIEWCRRHLEPLHAGFRFEHHDVANVHLNPGDGKPSILPFPTEDSAFTLVEAWSVFTHLTQPQAAFYLGEVARILRPEGILHSTWFLFDGRDFPMLHPHQAALYTSETDLSAAVIYERGWLVATAAAAGLSVISARSALERPVRGHQWLVQMTPSRPGVDAMGLPPDDYPYGAPVLPPLDYC